MNQAEPLLVRDVHAMVPYLAAAGHLHRVDLRADRPVGPRRAAPVFDGDPASPALGQRRPPPRHLGRQVESRQPRVAPREAAHTRRRSRGVARQQLAPVLIRVLPRRVGELVDEGLQVEAVRARPGRAPVAARHVVVSDHAKVVAVIRDKIRYFYQPPYLLVGTAGRPGPAILARGADVDGDGPPVSIHGRPQDADAHRLIPGAAAPVLVAGP